MECIECAAETRRIAFGGDMKLLTNTLTQCVCLSGLFLLIGGCVASSTTPDLDQTPATTFECEAGDSSWDCRAQQTATETPPTPVQPVSEVAEKADENVPWWRVRTRNRAAAISESRAAPAATKQSRQTRTVAKADTPKRERRGFFNIRMRGRDASTEARDIPKVVDTTPVPVVTTDSEPAPTRIVTLSQPNVGTSTRPTREVSEKPTNTPSSQATSQTANVFSSNPAATASKPVVVQVPVSGSNTTSTVRRSASPANPDVSLDGLGGDYDYAVQLAAFTNYGLSSNFMSSYPSLNLMRVKTESKGKTFYIVLAGTFESKQLASAQSQMLTGSYGMDEPYIRTVKSIRNVQIN